eukprot:scaffold72246_cov12-Tisochrysis_lutea.AAC.1
MTMRGGAWSCQIKHSRGPTAVVWMVLPDLVLLLFPLEKPSLPVQPSPLTLHPLHGSSCKEKVLPACLRAMPAFKAAAAEVEGHGCSSGEDQQGPQAAIKTEQI